MYSHIVIIGGGFGGLSAARAPPQRGRSRHADRSAQPSRLPAAALSGRNGDAFAGDIAAPIRWILRHISNVRVLLANATRIDTAARRIELSDGGSLDYDWLIVATGSKHAYFGHATGSRMRRASRRWKMPSASGGAS